MADIEVRRGHPSKYETHVLPYIEEIKKWVAQGIYEYEIYNKLGVTAETWIQYKRGKPEMLEIFTHKKELIVCELQRTLLKKAHGYSYTEKTHERTATGKLKTTKLVDKQVAPDTTAIIFALCNLDPENWQQRVDSKQGGQGTDNTSLDKLKKEIGALIDEYKNLETIEVDGKLIDE